MKAYGDSLENLRRLSILEMEGENGELHFSVLEKEDFNQLPVAVETCKNSSRCGGKQRIS
jgi:hypothetical protein